MVEFLKAKTSTYVNKPMGVIDTRTGGAAVGEALARAGNQAQQMFYADAVKNQKKLGQESVNNMKVQARDESGAFVYAQVDQSLSQVAKEVAEPMLRQRVGEALLVDASNGLTKIRSESLSAEDFENKSKEYIKANIANLDATGGGEYAGVYQSLATKTMAQHLNHMVLADAKKAKRIAVNNSLSSITIGLEEAAAHLERGVSFITIGELDDGNDELGMDQVISGLKLRAEQLFTNNDIEEPKYRAIINEIEKTTNDSRIRHKTNPMSENLDVNAITILEQSIRTGIINKADKETLDSYGINQDDINNFTKIRVNTDYHASKVATIRSIVSSRVAVIAKGNGKLALKNKLEGRIIHNMKPNEQILYNEILAEKYNGGKEINADWVLRNWEEKDGFLDDSLRGNKLPKAFEDVFNNAQFITNLISTEPARAKAMLISGTKLFANIAYRQSLGGNTQNNFGLSDTSFSNWQRLKRLSEQFGDASVLESAQKIFAPKLGNQTLSNIRMTNVENFSNFPDNYQGSTANSFINQWLRKYTADQGMNPEAASYLSTIAMHHSSIEGTDESTLKQILSDSYDNMYVESSYIWNIGQGTGLKSPMLGSGYKFKSLSSRFAPEKYFQGNKELLDKFIKETQNQLSKSTLKTNETLTIGENVFLLPSRRSTNTQGEYMVVDSTGTPIINKQTNNIFQISTKVTDGLLLKEKRKEQEDRWDRARRRRLSVIKSQTDAEKDLGDGFFGFGKIFGKTAF